MAIGSAQGQHAHVDAITGTSAIKNLERVPLVPGTSYTIQTETRRLSDCARCASRRTAPLTTRRKIYVRRSQLAISLRFTEAGRRFEKELCKPGIFPIGIIKSSAATLR